MARSVRYIQSEANKAKMLDLISTRPDLTMEQRAEIVGVALMTYRNWRNRDPDFRNKCERIQAGQSANLYQNGRAKSNGPGGGFAEFRSTFFPQAFPSPPLHSEIVRIIENAPPMSVTLILVPPNFGKSTIVSDYINWKLGEEPNHRFAVVSKGQEQAKKMLIHIKRRMEDTHNYSAYIGAYGPFYIENQQKLGKPWASEHITVARADHDERDHSLQCLGWTGQIYGSRVDTLILDDIQTGDNLSSVETMLDKFFLEYLSRGDAQMRTVIIGTRIAMGDIYERMMEGYDDGKSAITQGQLFVRPAVHLDENGDEVSLWPERWPLEALHKIRERSAKAWWTGYMMAPQRAGNATFTPALLEKAKNPTRSYGPLRGDLGIAPVVLGLDPALGGGNALVALSYTRDRIYLLDCIRETSLSRTEEILQRVEQFASYYHPADVVIENVAFQRGLARDDRMQEMASRYGFTIHEHATNRDKQDPILGVGSMARSFSIGEIDIPYEDEITQLRVANLLHELASWRPDVSAKFLQQDLVMAMWFAWRRIIANRQIMGVASDDWNRGGLAHYTQFRPLFRR